MQGRPLLSWSRRSASNFGPCGLSSRFLNGDERPATLDAAELNANVG